MNGVSDPLVDLTNFRFKVVLTRLSAFRPHDPTETPRERPFKNCCSLPEFGFDHV